MRRIGLPLILPLLGLLLFAQQGALLHELSHLRSDGGTLAGQVGESAAPQNTGPCLICEAFAQIAHPASGFASITATPAAAAPAAPDPLFSVIGASAPTPRSRGPPQA
ncbi:MAG: hypothetical protein ACREUT_17880 [Steroidobacteraceae bacterium]